MILDAACGRGYLLTKIMERYPDMKCIGCDYTVSEQKFEMVAGSILSLPFEDNTFDTVICTHALEHIKDHHRALRELLRVTKGRLIITVPRQREYKYTIDLHVHFFPYLYSFKQFVGIEKALYFDMQGDFLCRIDK
jgi:ubiquinone/menaquinone biosynthesis C-methylase UbiE